MEYRNKKVAILGYGIEGIDAEKYLKKKGALTKVLDRKFDESYLKSLNSFDVIVRSPGVYRYLPEIIEAEKNGSVVTSAINIFFQNCARKIIGVTGTKGKGTTSTLIYEILKKDGRDVYLAGNIGIPYLSLLSKIKKETIVVLEISSFQLIDMVASPNISVVLNVTEDHLDWHKDKKEYIDAKRNIVKYQSLSDFAVINADYKTSKSFAKNTKAKVIFFSKNELEKKYKDGLSLRGKHNLENIAAAVSVSKIFKIRDEVIVDALRSFKGLEHRLELAGEVRGITFYNDSFATGPQPTIAAIKSFKEPETLILGGSDKGLNYNELGKVISKAENLKTIILIGQIKDIIKRSILKFGYKGRLIELGKITMDEIVKRAYKETPKGGVILLSPAAASFDMFKDYKDRGNQFKKAVKELAN